MALTKNGENMPDWIKYAIVGILAASGTNIGTFVGIVQPAKAEVAKIAVSNDETQAANELIRDELKSCMAALRECYQGCSK